MTEWIGPFNLPTYANLCEEPTNVVITRTSATTATFDGADPAFTYQGSANRPGRPLRPYPMYGMNNITVPSTHPGLVAAFDYDVWFRTICANNEFSDWAGPFYLPTYNQAMPMKVSPNPTNGLVKIEGMEIVSVHVMGVTGKPVLTTRVINNELNLSKLAPGQYIIQAVDVNGKVQTSKVLKK